MTGSAATDDRMQETPDRRSLSFGPAPGSAIWWITKDGDEVCKKLYDRHYCKRKYKDGRQTKVFCGPGEQIVLRTWDGDALWVWRRNAGGYEDRWGHDGVCCAVFRNESPNKSSELVRQADAIADFCWPGVRHYTFVHPGRIRSTNPGCCFKAAGWRACGETKGGLVILERTLSPNEKLTQDAPPQ
jgi:hypothetical protein